MANYTAGENTKIKIIQAAKELFFEQGYNATTYADICQKVEIRQGNLHYHFKSKELLCVVVCSSFYRTLSEEAVKISGGKDDEYLTIVLIMYLFWYKFYNNEKLRRFSCETAAIYVASDDYDYFSKYFESIGKTISDIDFHSYGICLAIERGMPEIFMQKSPDFNFMETAEFVLVTYAKFLGPEEGLLKSTIAQAKILLTAFDLNTLSGCL